MYVVGNLPELGAWNHNQAIQLSQEHGSRDSPIFFDSNSSGEFYSDDGHDNAGDNSFGDIDDEQVYFMYFIPNIIEFY